MNNLLVVCPCCVDDAPLAERLLDWIYQMNGRQQTGHVLLAYSHDLHQEMKVKLKICAELAFESVSEFQATNRPLPSPGAAVELKTKVEFINNLWNQTAQHIAGHYRWPWLWCEPDCVPLRPDWISKLADAYAKQPMKFMGRKMKRMNGQNEQLFLARTAVYYAGAQVELKGFVGSPPFEWAAGGHVVPRSSSTKLIQQTLYDGDFSKVAPEAVLFHSDKTGKLIDVLRERGVMANGQTNGEAVQIKVSDRAGRWESKMILEEPLAKEFRVLMTDDPEPPDKRTKAWKEWRRRQVGALT